MQDLLFDSGSLEKDVVYTPDWCARDMVQHFRPNGRVLEPSKGGGAFLQYLPGADWCEIAEGRDFFRCFDRYDWIVGNPPYTGIPDWCRHSFALADDVVYLIPCRSVYLGPQFIRDVYAWGGIVETRHYGGGGQLGFPFGNAVAAFHFRKGWRGDMKVTHYKQPNAQVTGAAASSPRPVD